MPRLRTASTCLSTIALASAVLGATASANVSVAPARAVTPIPRARPLASTSIPQISGEKRAGGQLTTSLGSWSGAPTSYAFQWLLCDGSGQHCRPAPGLTAQTIAVPPEAANGRMRVEVTARTQRSSASATSRSTMLLAPAAPDPAPAPAAEQLPPLGTVLLRDEFSHPDGLITNEYSHWNETHSDATISPVWAMTSGSLFAQEGTGWTGVPDGCPTSSPDSAPCTASDVFRLNSLQHDFGNVTVSLDLRNNSLTSSPRTPPENWDGVHLWLHYQSEYNLYYASFNRRDGHIVIKKKCLGGDENGGTYYELGGGELAGYPIPFGSWQQIAARIQDNPDGSVTITMYRGGSELLSATDTGIGCPPIANAGSVGIRGDNDDFNFDNFVVTSN